MEYPQKFLTYPDLTSVGMQLVDIQYFQIWWISYQDCLHFLFQPYSNIPISTQVTSSPDDMPNKCLSYPQFFANSTRCELGLATLPLSEIDLVKSYVARPATK